MKLLLPEIILLLTGLSVLAFDLIKLKASRQSLLLISLSGISLSFAALFVPLIKPTALPAAFFSNLYVVDIPSIFFKGLFLLVGLLIVLINYDFFAAQVKKHEGEFYFLLLTSLLGLMIIASSPNLLLIYIGLEIVGQSSYLLVGWQKNVLRSSEAALKYFLFGAVASAVFLYGVSLFYGLTGSLNLSQPLNPYNLQLTAISLLFMLLGFGFKIAMVPMQFWCPDVYEGAPTPITAYLSVGPKAAGFAVLLRFLGLLKPDMFMLLAIFSVLTMTWGNFVALRQTNIKRLLAYSSIAQAGYILIGLVSPELGYPVVGFYLLAYAFANLGAFALVIYLSQLTGSEEIDSYAGLARRSPAAAAAFTIFFLSLIGIPPLGGFVGKFLLFKAAIGAGFLWLALLAVVNSVVSVYYYLGLMRVMYFQPGNDQVVKLPFLISLVVFICFALTLLLGLFPNLANNFFLNI